nr:hypothetical protein [Tanacetum cinerariifolium]
MAEAAKQATENELNNVTVNLHWHAVVDNLSQIAEEMSEYANMNPESPSLYHGIIKKRDKIKWKNFREKLEREIKRENKEWLITTQYFKANNLSRNEFIVTLLHKINEISFLLLSSCGLGLCLHCRLVPSCYVIFDLEPLSLSFDFVYTSEIFKSFSLNVLIVFAILRSCVLVPTCPYFASS